MNDRYTRQPFAFPGTPERWSRDRRVDMEHVCLELDVDLEARTLEGRVTHRFRPLARELNVLVLDAVEMAILGVTGPAGQDLEHAHDGRRLTIRFGEPLAAGEPAHVEVRYRVERPRRGFYFVGPTEACPDRPLMAWSQGQDQDSRYWWPSYDHPNERASTEMRVSVPAGCYALSNGALEERVSLEGGRERFHWRQRGTHVAYLVTLVVGPFAVLEEGVPVEGGDEIPLLTLVEPGREEEARRAIEGTAQMLRLLSEKTGVPYPWEKYAQVFVAEFTFGGMENTSATTLTDETLRDERAALDSTSEDLVAHELAHQWFGDLVTCRDWSHAWLNEGFATYCEVVWKTHARGRDEGWWHLEAMGRRYREEARRRYVRPILCRRWEQPIDLFDAHLYLKGAWVLHTLCNRLGEESFWASVRRYLTEHRESGLVEVSDLRRAAEAVTGRDLGGFFHQWVESPGIPELRIEADWRPEEGELLLRITQTQEGEGVPDAFEADTSIDIAVGGTWTRHALALRHREQEMRIPLQGAPEAVAFDPEWSFLRDVEFDPPPAWLHYQLREGRTAPARADAARALASDGSRRSVEALEDALLDEEELWGVRGAAAESLGKIPGSEAAEALVEGLAAGHPKVRRAAAKALARHRGERGFEALGERFRSGDASYLVEAELARSLGRMREEEAVRILLEIGMERDSWNEVVRAGVLEGLMQTGDPRAVEAALEATSKDRPPRLRVAAAGALGEAAWAEPGLRRRARLRLEELLGDGHFRVRLAAAEALGDLGEPDAKAVLRRLAESTEDGRIRRAAREALRRLSEGGGWGRRARDLEDALEEARSRLSRLERKVESPAGGA